jgi:hypothetical protein
MGVHLQFIEFMKAYNSGYLVLLYYLLNEYGTAMKLVSLIKMSK